MVKASSTRALSVINKNSFPQASGGNPPLPVLFLGYYSTFCPRKEGGAEFWRIEIFLIALFDIFCYTVICSMPWRWIFCGLTAQNNTDAPPRPAAD